MLPFPYFRSMLNITIVCILYSLGVYKITQPGLILDVAIAAYFYTLDKRDLS
jgi:hypothetical protein